MDSQRSRSELLSRILQQMNYRQAQFQPQNYGALAAGLGAQFADAFNVKNQMGKQQAQETQGRQALGQALQTFAQQRQGGMDTLPGTGVQLGNPAHPFGGSPPDEAGAQAGLSSRLATIDNPIAQALLGQQASQMIQPPPPPQYDYQDLGGTIGEKINGRLTGRMLPKTPTPDAVMKEEGDNTRFFEGQDRTDKRLAFTEGNAFKRLNMQLANTNANAGITNDKQRLQQEHLMRGEFNQLPLVVSYNKILPMLQSIKNAPDTPAGDLDFTYAISQISDPGSATKEGEQTMVIKAGTALSRILGSGVFNFGTTRISQQQRQELIAMADNKVSQFEKGYSLAKERYDGLARKMGSDPMDITGPHPMDAYSAKSGATQKGGWSIEPAQ